MSRPEAPSTPRAARGLADAWALVPLATGCAVLAWLCFLSADHARWLRLHWLLESAQWPVFSDLDAVLHGIRQQAAGIDPFAVRDPEYPWAYPRLWLHLRHLEVHHLPLVPGGAVLGALWLVCTVALCRVRTPGLAVTLAALLLTPPVLLALERANVDLAMFLLCAGAVVARTSERLRWLAPWPIALAAALKFYPAAALALGFLETEPARRRNWMVAAVVVALAWAASFGDFAVIGQRVDLILGGGFGHAILPLRYARYLTDLFGTEFSRAFLFGISLAVFAAVVVASAWFGRRLAGPIACSGTTAVERDCFCLAALVCIGSFALGHNFAYRFVFALPALPLLWRVLTHEDVPRFALRWAAFAAGCLVLTFFGPIWGHGRSFIVAQLASWALMGVLASGAAALFVGRRRIAGSLPPEPSTPT